MKRIFSRQPRLAMGVKVAIAVLAHGKVAASANIMNNTPPSSEPQTSAKKAAVRKFLAEQAEVALSSGKDALTSASEAWEFLVEYAHDAAPESSAMSYEEARLWLQSYNAGPYALLKFKGNVPYKETRNYVPKVMKYYQQDLSDTPYDSYIVGAARKYGLDPQMIRAIMKTESDFRRTTVSSAGARGLMQVMPVVWSEVRKRYNLDWNYSRSVFEPQKNIEVACAYLAWLRYDFLPRHFAEFDPNQPAPATLVRDKTRPAKNRIETAAVPAPKTLKVEAGKVEHVANGKTTTRRLSGGRTKVTVRGTGKTPAKVADVSARAKVYGG